MAIRTTDASITSNTSLGTSIDAAISRIDQEINSNRKFMYVFLALAFLSGLAFFYVVQRRIAIADELRVETFKEYGNISSAMTGLLVSNKLDEIRSTMANKENREAIQSMTELIKLKNEISESRKEFDIAIRQVSGNGHYFLFVFMIIVFGTSIALFRFFLRINERLVYQKLGFLRLRVAGNNSKQGFETDVRKALTANAFAPSFGKIFEGDEAVSIVGLPHQVLELIKSLKG